MKPSWNPKTLELFYDYGAMGYLYRFEKIVDEHQTKHQNVKVLQHKRLGKCITIDNDIMGSEFDDQYDAAMLKLIGAIPYGTRIRNVLILGGGDCSLAARLVHEYQMSRVVVVEIDSQIPGVYQKHFPESTQLPGEVTMHFGDALEYIEACKPGDFDLVIDDMFTVPHNGGVNYHSRIARKFAGKHIVSQTDSRNNGVSDQILRDLQARGMQDVERIEHFIPTYMENWTFTRYRDTTQS